MLMLNMLHPLLVKPSAALLMLVLLAPAVAHATEDSGITVHPHAGVATSGNIKGFGQDTGFGLGVGYQFSNKWAVEFVRQQASSTLKTSGKPNIDIDSWHLDALYHLPSNDVFVPYVSTGLGAIDYAVEGAADDDSNVYNIAVGLKHALGAFTDLRAEVRSFRSLDSVYAGTVTSLGFQHRFGSPAPTLKAAAAVSTPIDDDQDGVPNALDLCPNTAANTLVDDTGCVPDRDKDGVPDSIDNCPATTNRRARIDSQGCYVMQSEQVAASEVFYFDTDSFAPRAAHNEKLRRLQEFINNNPTSEVAVTGHADNRGDADYNMKLSRNRAELIAASLLQRVELEASRLTLHSYGETQPAQQDTDPKGHAANRRVTVSVGATKRSIALK